jgi:hypothetical protein
MDIIDPPAHMSVGIAFFKIKVLVISGYSKPLSFKKKNYKETRVGILIFVWVRSPCKISEPYSG